MARYTVKQLARLSGVSVRTLHYYDEIELFKPTDVGTNGYRYYDRDAVLRLQQILFYRELGMPLDKVKQTLDSAGFNLSEALAEHRQHLIEQVDRNQNLIRTIDATLQELNGEETMSDQDRFKGFAPEKQAEYEDYLVGRYGEQAKDKIATSHRKVGKMSAEQMAAVQAKGDQVNKDLVVEIDAGAEPGDARVQALIAKHHAWVSHFWVPNAEAYAGLGQLYLDHKDFRAFYDKYDARLVEFLAVAMKIYAAKSLH